MTAPSSTVLKFAADIVRKEGGFNDRHADAGGPTNCGVSLAWARDLPKVNGRSPMDLDGNGVVDVRDIRLVTPAIAAVLFIDHFYTALRVNELPECIQAMQFDMNVNGGPGGGGTVLQLAIALVNKSLSIRVDGQVGDATIKAAAETCAKVGAAAFAKAYVAARIGYYERIVERNPSQRVFLAGWINRAKSFGA